jgi:ribonuclease VapC
VSEVSIFDSSALIALMRGEPGWEVAAEYAENAIICAVNLSEVVAKFVREGGDPDQIAFHIRATELRVVDFDAGLAFEAGNLIRQTAAFGLSLGDRACLALAKRETLPVLTSDTAWRDVDIGVNLIFIR